MHHTVVVIVALPHNYIGVAMVSVLCYATHIKYIYYFSVLSTILALQCPHHIYNMYVCDGNVATFTAYKRR